ncbi:purine-cytosine permease [Gloeophyllum trabeum ATCC 11539]|uniref:Purine-cytosine permease n=1 Tax=Gloeophyllum trabeum (strain ATCC 11539 / FP-39264 / Madison 617) TaxID=670483 RepID=S7PUY0_GLOTA|nr:purine-cytosine permease [Gloeophyllum trabeum ATCC 11539]EPQ51243.1 purine-cytosine permease [Gloeophyllum trabeum ATCC 11539]
MDSSASQSSLHHSNDDTEKQSEPLTTTAVVGLENADDGVPRNRGLFAKLWAIVQKLDKYGVEARGIERVPPTERPQKSPWDCFTMWCAANTQLGAFSGGTLAPGTFGMSLRDSVLCIVFFNILWTVPVAYLSTFGCRTGLRQMVFSRFAFGYWFCMLPGLLNCVGAIGWTIINTIVGGKTLRAVSSTHQIPVWASNIIIAILSLLPPFAGYRFVHNYQRWSWIAPAVIFFIMLGTGLRYMEGGTWGATGPLEAATVLSFGTVVVGYGLGWASYAGDYTVNLPEDTPTWKIFAATYLGLNTSLILVESLGAAYMTTIINNSAWSALYDANGVGGLIAAGLTPLNGIGHFFTLLMALSVVANNIPNVYSLSLTVPIFGPVFQAVPRLFITLIGTAVYIVLSIVGASHFEAWLDTLLVLLSYWQAIFATLVIEEHVIFRRSWRNYELDSANKRSALPPGIAASVAFGCGVMGAVFGVAQSWYIGILARKIGDPTVGGNIGFELSLAFSGIAYPPLRYLERRLFGR